MRSAVPVILVILAGLAIAENPGEAFENLVDAVYEGDTEQVEDMLSSETLGMIEITLAMVKLQPVDAAASLAEELQIELTSEDLVTWTPSDFINAVVLSPRFLEELPLRDEITITHFDMNGDTSTVYVAVSGISTPFDMVMIREGDNWKLGENFLIGDMQ